MTCSKCHKEGHKSNKCPQPSKKFLDEKNKKKHTIKSSLIYTKLNRRNKSNSNHLAIGLLFYHIGGAIAFVPPVGLGVDERTLDCELLLVLIIRKFPLWLMALCKKNMDLK